MSARQEQRIAKLEQQVSMLLREVARVNARPGSRLVSRLGIAIGKTDAAISKGASGTVSIWDGVPGSEADTGKNWTDVFNRWVNIGTGKWVLVVRFRGRKYLLQAECPLT